MTAGEQLGPYRIEGQHQPPPPFKKTLGVIANVTEAAMDAPLLWHIPLSHFNEKVRWALRYLC